jgi:hypothetical protein
MRRAEHWLRDCLEDHESCVDIKSSFTPTRLVLIADGEPRVRFRDEIPQHTRYATLSHCWGSTRFVTLLKENCEKFRSRISPNALSKTIRESIETARLLGFWYIWIDTLCIVQDDEEDWEREATSMAAVYGGSALNLAASGAIDGTIGLISERPPHWRCQAQLHDGHEYRLYEVIPQQFDSRVLNESPLMQRGWALQERILPTRTLHFTKTEMFWECKKVTACETFANGIPGQVTKFSDSYFAKRSLVSNMWTWIIQSYSRCRLTYPTDKLVAIAGLARQAFLEQGDQYIAGMWKKDLVYQLCWWVPEPRASPLITTYIAPSWSWASVDQAVAGYSMIPDASHNITIRMVWIINIDIKFASPDPFGTMLGATLSLGCRMLVPAQYKAPSLVKNNMKIFCYIYMDVLQDFETSPTKDVVILPFFDRPSTGHVDGLLLERTGHGRGVYRRVGRFHFEKYVWWREVLDMMKVEKLLDADADDCYMVLHGGSDHEEYVIKLI